MLVGNDVDIVHVQEEKIDGVGGIGIIIDQHELILYRYDKSIYIRNRVEIGNIEGFVGRISLEERIAGEVDQRQVEIVLE